MDGADRATTSLGQTVGGFFCYIPGSFFTPSGSAVNPTFAALNETLRTRPLIMFAKRPQVQERLTAQVADTLMQELRPHGVLVVLEAEHFCMTMRGVRKAGSRMVTSAVRGALADNEITRKEALSLIGKLG